MKFRVFTLVLFISIIAKSYSQTSIESANNLVQVLVEKYLDLEGRPPGISIAVSQNNEIVFAHGFGYADISKNKPVIVETQFRTASVAKLITATSLARLIQENRIDLDAPISKYFKSVPKKYAEITTRQLAGHIGGVTHYSEEDKIENRFYSSVDDALNVFIHIDPLSKPGDNYLYTTYGYVLLSKIIEQASGQKFLDYLENQVFRPLNMHSTGPELRREPSKHMTKIYDVYQDGINKGYAFNQDYQEDPSYKWAGGGFISTPTDLIKMANAYTNGFIRPDVVEEMFRSQKVNSGKETGVGIGWRGSYDMAGRRVFEHAGYQRGTRSVLSFFPHDKTAVAILANAHFLNRIEESAHMLALPYLKETSATEQPKGVGKVTVNIIDYDGNLTTEEAKIVLNGESDRIIFSRKDGVENTYPFVYMERDNIYALIHNDGILYSELRVESSKLKGKIMRYKSPLLSIPSTQKPFMKFEGVFKSLSQE